MSVAGSGPSLWNRHEASLLAVLSVIVVAGSVVGGAAFFKTGEATDHGSARCYTVLSVGSGRSFTGTTIAATGRVGTNHAAVDYYLANPEAVAPALVAAGLHWRTVPPGDQPAALALLERELRPLYLEYIDDHTTRLEELGSADLAAAFTAWRRRLTA